MSGIYGYYSKNRTCIPGLFDRALTGWNANYGSRVISHSIDSGRLSVNLEHFSARVKEQETFLENEVYLAVIDALLYNREEFDAAGVLSDEELLFQLVCRDGFDALKDVNGDFAGVFYHKATGDFTLFTDHLGVRPLFYYIDEKSFVFSTDMRALLAIPACSLTINERVLYEQLTETVVSTPSDFDFNEIHVVQKGSWCTVKKDMTTQAHAYWRIGQKKIRLRDEAAYQQELYRLVSDAVTRRAAAVDGTLGAELSGGLDSSVISILLHRTGRDCRFYSWSRSPEHTPIVQENDERNIISAICRQENIQVHYYEDPSDKSIQTLLQEMDPPYGNTTTIRLGSRWFAGQGVQAVFSGHGGDEGVSHRCNLYELWYHREYIPYLKAIYRTKQGKSLKLLRTLSTTAKTVLSAKKQLSVIHNQEGFFDALLNPDYRSRMQQVPEIPLTFSYDVVAYINHSYINNRPKNTAYQASESGIRYLFPYLDYRVIDYAASIPRWLYNNGLQNRRIYIETFRKIVPDELIRYFAKATVSKSCGENDSDYMRALMHDLLAELDEDLWKPFLNMDAVRQLQLPEGYTEAEYTKFILAQISLYYCVQLQYTWQHAEECCNEI